MKAIPLTAFALALAGCANEPQPIVPEPMPPMNVRTAPALQNTPMVQTSRYTLTNPAHGARLVDILNVSVEARIPSIGSALSVEDGLSFLLSESGVHLREPLSYGEAQLYKQPLPLAHTDLGIMPLREALQVLGGEAFALQEDVVKREVGFTLKDGYVWQPPKYDETLRSESMKKGRSSGQVAKHTARPSQSSTDDMQDQNDALFAGGVSTPVSSQSQKVIEKLSVGKVKSATGRLTFQVKAGESYRTALLRWMNRSGIKHVAMAKVPSFQSALSQQASKPFQKKGTLGQAVAALSYQVDELNNLTYTPKPSLEMGALHPYKLDAVTLFLLQGKTLSDAGEFAAKQYGWKWQQQVDLPSYRFGQTYPMVTKRGDVNQAMNEILAPYPLKVQRLDESRTLYLRKASEL